MNDYLKITCWSIAVVGMGYLGLVEGFDVLYDSPLACVGMALVGLGLCKEGQQRLSEE